MFDRNKALGLLTALDIALTTLNWGQRDLVDQLAHQQEIRNEQRLNQIERQAAIESSSRAERTEYVVKPDK